MHDKDTATNAQTTENQNKKPQKENPITNDFVMGLSNFNPKLKL